MKNRGLGEIEERREPMFPGSGFSKGQPNVPVKPRPSVQVSSGSTVPFFVTTIAQKIITANMLRVGLSFQNRSAGTIWLGIKQSPGNFVGTPPIAAFELAAGAVWEPNYNGRGVYFDDVYAVSSVDNLLLVFIETIATTS